LLTAHHGAHSFAKSPKGVMLPVAASYFNTLRGFGEVNRDLRCFIYTGNQTITP